MKIIIVLRLKKIHACCNALLRITTVLNRENMTEIFHQRLGKIVLLTELFRYKIRIEQRKLDFSRVFTLYGSFSLTFRYSSFLREVFDTRDKKMPIPFSRLLFYSGFYCTVMQKMWTLLWVFMHLYFNVHAFVF